MSQKTHHSSYFLTLFMLLCTSVLLFSCSVVPVVISSDPDMQKLKLGETLFEQEHYKEAEKTFIAVLEAHIPINTANTAVYNLACTRIMQAKTLEDLSNALILLDTWRQTSQPIISVENPQMVITAQKKIAQIIEADVIARQLEDKKNKQIILQQSKMIETLQHQISALEAIDQELQEKKKPL